MPNTTGLLQDDRPESLMTFASCSTRRAATECATSVSPPHLIKKTRGADLVETLDQIEAEADKILAATIQQAERRQLDELGLLSFTLAIEQARQAIAARRAALSVDAKPQTAIAASGTNVAGGRGARRSSGREQRLVEPPRGSAVDVLDDGLAVAQPGGVQSAQAFAEIEAQEEVRKGPSQPSR